MKQFFSNTGLTSTSANYICNVAKEYLETLHEEIRAFKSKEVRDEFLTNFEKQLEFIKEFL